MKGTDRFRVHDVRARVGERELEVVDMSVAGLFVADPGLLPSVGQEFTPELRLPGQAPLSFLGRVAWINEHERPRRPALPPGFGLRIVRIGFTEKMALLHFLASLGRRERPVAAPRA